MESHLEVPGARLFYRTSGSGPLLLLIPAANGDTKLFERITPLLSSDYTVCTYDRRGFSRSPLKGEQDYSSAGRAARDADDAATLIAHLSPSEKAFVFGSSSGAMVALELLARHPDPIRLTVSHEPPAMANLRPELLSGMIHGGKISSMYDEWKATGDYRTVIEKFAKAVGNDDDTVCLKENMLDPANKANVEYWLEHEYGKEGPPKVDVETLRKQRQKLVVAAGKENKDHWLYSMAEDVARQTDAKFVELPAAHMGYHTHPKEFTEGLLKVLREGLA